MTENIKISVNILPFGHMKLIFSSTEQKLETLEREKIPVYAEPHFTNIEKFEIFYKGREVYTVPKTTDGS